MKKAGILSAFPPWSLLVRSDFRNPRLLRLGGKSEAKDNLGGGG